MTRDNKDYAIEFGEYLAKAAEHYQAAVQGYFLARQADPSTMTDAWVALNSAVYEFRKRAARVKKDTPTNA